MSGLKLMRAATGGPRWSSRSRGVMWVRFGWLKIRCAAAFWTIWSGFAIDIGIRRVLQVDKKLQISVELVVK